MRLSISAKIFLGFLVVLVTFAAATAYGALTMRRLGDELRLVSRGYFELRSEVKDLQAGQSNLLKVLADQLARPEGATRIPRFVKVDIDNARRSRLTQQMKQAQEHLEALEVLRSSAEEKARLLEVKKRLGAIGQRFADNEELFDAAYGPIGLTTLPAADPAQARAAGERLMHREQAIKRDLAYLSADLRMRTQEVLLELEREESRAVWATLLLAVIALVVGVIVMIVATRLLSPLRRLAERAQQIARGDYRQRVDAGSPDEIGALGQEFNAMAAALEEREQQLIRSERLAAVGKIAAQITHEVRNPLSSIGLNAELLEEEIGQLGGAPAGEAQSIARAIVKEVDRLTEITEGYLRLTRVPQPRLEREDLGAIVRSLIAFQRSELESGGVTVVLALPADLPPVRADEHQLRQALLNLARNAREAMPNGGCLTLEARVGDGAVELDVRDTGAGIAPEHAARIFEPFFSTKEGGTGLGLALTQQIIQEHGGRVSVHAAPGGGTCFRVRLPIDSDAPKRSAGPQPQSPAERTHPT